MTHHLVQPLVHRAVPVVLFAIALVAITGCAAPADAPRGTDLGALASDHVEQRSVPLQSSERGLEVRQWLVADDTERIAATMTRLGSADILPEQQQEALRRNGLRLVRLKLEDLNALEADLNGASLNTIGWYGQIFQWREIMTRPLRQPRSIAIDGRPRTFQPGELRFLARAWIAQMEDGGAYLSFQFVPQHYREGPMSYYKLLGRETGEGETFTSMSLDMLLEEGHAYVLTCESPLVDWVDVTAGHQHETSQRDREDNDGDDEAPPVGPDTRAPTTLGQFMLSTERGRRGRGLLIFIPRIETQSRLGFTELPHHAPSAGRSSASQ